MPPSGLGAAFVAILAGLAMRPAGPPAARSPAAAPLESTRLLMQAELAAFGLGPVRVEISYSALVGE